MSKRSSEVFLQTPTNLLVGFRVGIKPGFYHKAQPGGFYGFYEGGFLGFYGFYVGFINLKDFH